MLKIYDHMEFGLIRCTKKFKQYIWLEMVIYEYLIIRLKWYTTWLEIDISVQTKNQFSSLEFDTSLATFINGFLSDGEAIEEWLTSP
jgi:hypothetical protein